MATFTVMSRCHEWRGDWVPEEGSPQWIRDRQEGYAAMKERPGKRMTDALEFAEMSEDAQTFILRKLSGHRGRIHWADSPSCKHVRRSTPQQNGEAHKVSGLVFNRMILEQGRNICFFCKRDFEYA